jgi:hypothetical protein
MEVKEGPKEGAYAMLLFIKPKVQMTLLCPILLWHSTRPFFSSSSSYSIFPSSPVAHLIRASRRGRGLALELAIEGFHVVPVVRPLLAGSGSGRDFEREVVLGIVLCRGR